MDPSAKGRRHLARLSTNHHCVKNPLVGQFRLILARYLFPGFIAPTSKLWIVRYDFVRPDQVCNLEINFSHLTNPR
jgi:hypothetical protein